MLKKLAIAIIVGFPVIASAQFNPEKLFQKLEKKLNKNDSKDKQVDNTQAKPVSPETATPKDQGGQSNKLDELIKEDNKNKGGEEKSQANKSASDINSLLNEIESYSSFTDYKIEKIDMLGVRHLVDSFVKNNCTGSMKYDKSSLLNVIGISYNAPFPLNAEKAQKIKNNEQPMSFDGWGKPLNTCGGRSISDLLNVIAQRGDEFGSRRYEQHLKFKKEEAENNEREAKAREERRAAAIAAENEEKRKNEARIKEEKRIFEENAAKRKVDLRAGKVEPIDIYELSYKYDAPIDITIVTNPPLTADQKNYVVAGYLEKVEEKLLGGKVMFFRFNTDMGVRYSQAEIDSKTIIKTPLRMNGDYAVAGKFIGVTKRTLNTGLEITIPRFQALYIME